MHSDRQHDRLNHLDGRLRRRADIDALAAQNAADEKRIRDLLAKKSPEDRAAIEADVARLDEADAVIAARLAGRPRADSERRTLGQIVGVVDQRTYDFFVDEF